ncbi:MAG: HAMP domain-containing sensor histidine kinase [Candidatus Aminicenantes bacterium]
MSKKRSLTRYVVIFVLAQIAWFSLVGLWIYRFISSRMILKQVDESLSSWVMSESANIFTLVLGCVLFLAISIGMSLIFRNFTVQYKLTGLYDNFIANITHELKTPLASIQLNLETLKKRDLDRSQQEKFITLMLKDTGRLQRLINAILEIAGLEQKKAVYRCAVFTAGPAVRELVQKSRERLKLPENAVTISGQAECVCVIDKNAFRILIDNLMDNAVKYSRGPVQIHVALQCTAKKFIMEFSDAGIGIPSKYSKKVFSKFHRVYRPDAPNVKGTGLGLHWVKEIIRYHGGKVKALKREKGAAFRIELPIYQVSKKRYLKKLLKRARNLGKV